MKSLQPLRKTLDRYDKRRESVIQGSRKVIQASKTVIYAIHRDEMENAKKALTAMEEKLVQLKTIAKKEPKLQYEGIFRVAIQEYVEAESLFSFVATGNIIPYKQEYLDPELYLLGLCDLSGELVRKAIHASIKDNYQLPQKIRKTIEDLFTELSKFDLRNGELRRKYDGIKYDLKKMDDLVFQLKMKDKI